MYLSDSLLTDHWPRWMSESLLRSMSCSSLVKLWVSARLSVLQLGLQDAPLWVWSYVCLLSSMSSLQVRTLSRWDFFTRSCLTCGNRSWVCWGCREGRLSLPPTSCIFLLSYCFCISQCLMLPAPPLGPPDLFHQNLEQSQVRFLVNNILKLP